MMIGLSVSLCVADILEGRVKLEDVEKIISGLNVANACELEKVITAYQRHYWAKDPERAAKIVRRFWRESRILQPRRVFGFPPHLVDTGHWVEFESEIRWMEDWVEPGS